MTMIKHFVTFCSPGTFMSETSTYEIDKWDVEEAIKLSRGVSERYGAKPYGFYFSTRSRGDNDLDSKEVGSSNFYYLGGKVESKKEVFARNDPKEATLRSNMEINGYNYIIVNDNSYRFTSFLRDTDIVLEYTP